MLARWRQVSVLSQQRRGAHCPDFGSPLVGQDWKGQSLIAGAASSLSVYICPFPCLHGHFQYLVGPLQLAGSAHNRCHTSSWAPGVSSQCNSYRWFCLSFNEEIIPSDIFLISESLWVLKTIVSRPLIGEMKNDPPKKGIKLNSLFTDQKAVWVDLFIWKEGVVKIGVIFLICVNLRNIIPAVAWFPQWYPACRIETGYRLMVNRPYRRPAVTVCNQVVAVV